MGGAYDEWSDEWYAPLRLTSQYFNVRCTHFLLTEGFTAYADIFYVEDQYPKTVASSFWRCFAVFQRLATSNLMYKNSLSKIRLILLILSFQVNLKCAIFAFS